MRKKQKNRIKVINIYKFNLKNKIFAFFLVFFILIFLYIKFLATPIIIANTETQVRSYAARSINYAIAETMNQNISYTDFITITRDENNNISLIEANSVRVNLLAKTMSRVVLSNFLEFAKTPIKISLGAFTGIAIFAGFGPKVSYSINPYGEVYCYFTSEFNSAGINQTNHKIYLNISITVNVVLPFKKIVVTSESDVLLCETVIVGEIPDVYLNSSSLNDMLDLVPDKFTS